MKRVLSVLVLVCLMLCSAAFAEEAGFVFEGVITWETTVEEAMAFLGENVERVDDSDEKVGTAVLLQGKDVKAFGHDTFAVSMLFLNDKLCTIEVLFEDEDVESLADLAAAASEVYGAAVAEEQSFSLFGFFGGRGGDSTYCKWTAIPDTSIKLIQLDSEYKCCFKMENEPVWDAINALIAD